MNVWGTERASTPSAPRSSRRRRLDSCGAASKCATSGCSLGTRRRPVAAGPCRDRGRCAASVDRVNMDSSRNLSSAAPSPRRRCSRSRSARRAIPREAAARRSLSPATRRLRRSKTRRSSTRRAQPLAAYVDLRLLAVDRQHDALEPECSTATRAPVAIAAGAGANVGALLVRGHPCGRRRRHAADRPRRDRWRRAPLPASRRPRRCSTVRAAGPDASSAAFCLEAVHDRVDLPSGIAKLIVEPRFEPAPGRRLALADAVFAGAKASLRFRDGCPLLRQLPPLVLERVQVAVDARDGRRVALRGRSGSRGRRRSPMAAFPAARAISIARLRPAIRNAADRWARTSPDRTRTRRR